MGGRVLGIHGRVAPVGMAGNPILDSLAEFRLRQQAGVMNVWAGRGQGTFGQVEIRPKLKVPSWKGEVIFLRSSGSRLA